MRCKRKHLLFAIILVIVFGLIMYHTFMHISVCKNNEEVFRQQVGSILSFYEYQLYTMFLLPMYLVFFISMSEQVLQRIVRSRNKKIVALKEIGVNIFCALLFVSIIYAIGTLYPLLYGVMSGRLSLIHI